MKKKTQIQLPDPLYKRFKHVAEMNDRTLAEVVRRATELYVRRFPEADAEVESVWSFPTIKAGGEYLVDPAEVASEADASMARFFSRFPPRLC